LLIVCATAAIPSSAQTFTTLHSFDGTDGSLPFAGLVQATNGDLYGTTVEGGANFDGTVFKITPSGKLTTVHSFAGYPSDGADPYAGLVLATNGNLYGTTLEGGTDGSGTVFKITTGGALLTLYSFCTQANCTDGQAPQAGLIQAPDGDFYGTTYSGGSYAQDAGTVFKITPGGTLTTLYTFCAQSGCTDGDYPAAGLVQASNGDFYGTTPSGGTSSDCALNCGTVFKITASGTLTTLYSFDGTDGHPEAAMVQAANGNLYGTTGLSGAGDGTVFEITPGGTLTTLHSFDGTDGYGYIAGLIQATDGNLYGTTAAGGANGYGTIFRITPGGTLTTLYSFDYTDGSGPDGTLVQDTNGKLYGTTAAGGANDFGTVFSLSVGLGPFVETLPGSGKVGAAVKILGTDLTGATSVTFNGTAAVFTVVSGSLMTTNVPTGASTGFVTVTTPSRTLKSNRKFRVTP
jgi:uncharacterized repeat protein (TIGR03803 family)